MTQTVQSQPGTGAPKGKGKGVREESSIIASFAINAILIVFVIGSCAMIVRFDHLGTSAEFDAYYKNAFIFITPCIADCLLRLADSEKRTRLGFGIDVIFLICSICAASVSFSCILTGRSNILGGREMSYLLALYPLRIGIRFFYDIGCLYQIKTMSKE